MLFFGTILSGVATSAIITNQRVERTIGQEAIASGIALRASGLSYLSNEYLIYRESQQLDRWHSSFESYSADVAKLLPEGPEQQVLVLNILENTGRMRDVFESTVSVMESPSQNPEAVLDYLKVSWSRMAVQSQELVTDATRLSQLLHAQTEQLKQFHMMIVYAMIGTVGAYFLVNYTITQRHTLKSIETLQAGTAVIGAGNLDFKIAERENDEIGDLSRAFNLMTSDLKTVTASKTDLEREIDERKKAEAALKESEERYRKIVTTADEGIWVVSSEARTTFVNRRMADMLGYTSDEMIGRKSPDFMTEEHKSLPGIKLEQRRLGISETFELNLLHKDGSIVNTLSSSSPLFDNDGRFIGSFGMLTDITKRKREEEALRRYATDLEVSNKELEAFAYSVSHDLRGPLRALDGFSQVVADDYADKLDANGKDYLTRIRAAAQHMSRITEDMLKLSQVIRSELGLDTVNLSGTVTLISRELMARETARKVEFAIAPGVTVTGDASLLQLALQNLLENAWKFTAKCPGARIEFGVTQRDGKRVYFVRDNGIGFDMKYADKLFQPFQRLHSDKTYQGTGIGLAIVQRVIRRHSGQVWAESEINKGTAVYFTLGTDK
jgi:PAS domain S-box-containing protein